jgi:predicted nuclease of predicted toxin-antitoxin system
MKILIDMNLSPDLTVVLEAENIEGNHQLRNSHPKIEPA